MFKFILAIALLIFSLPNQLGAQQVEQESGVIVLQSTDGVIFPDALGEVVLRFSAPPMPGNAATFSKLNNPQVQIELELMERQQQQLRDLQTSFAKKIKEIRSVPSQGSPQHEERAREIAIKKAEEEQKKKIEEILIPHQLDRLKQITWQMKLKRFGYSETLTDQDLADLLGISNEQKERIKKRAAELNAEMDKEMAELKKKARKKLLRELTPEQQKQLEEMLGPEFDDKPVDPLKRIGKIQKSSREKKD